MGPKHHWFGYYDKLQFDPTGRYALGIEVDFEHRPPTPEDVIRIGMVDLADGGLLVQRLILDFDERCFPFRIQEAPGSRICGFKRDCENSPLPVNSRWRRPDCGDARVCRR